MSRWLIAVGEASIARVDQGHIIGVCKKSGGQRGEGLIFEGGILSGGYGTTCKCAIHVNVHVISFEISLNQSE